MRLTENLVIARSMQSNLASVEYLDLWDSCLSDISIISKLVAVKTLYLGRNNISSLAPLEGCLNLRRLSLYKNQISDFDELDYLKNLPALEHLEFARNPCQMKAGQKYRQIILSKLPNLKQIDDRDVCPEEVEQALRECAQGPSTRQPLPLELEDPHVSDYQYPIVQESPNTKVVNRKNVSPKATELVLDDNGKSFQGNNGGAQGLSTHKPLPALIPLELEDLHVSDYQYPIVQESPNTKAVNSKNVSPKATELVLDDNGKSFQGNNGGAQGLSTRKPLPALIPLELEDTQVSDYQYPIVQKSPDAMVGNSKNVSPNATEFVLDDSGKGSYGNSIERPVRSRHSAVTFVDPVASFHGVPSKPTGQAVRGGGVQEIATSSISGSPKHSFEQWDNLKNSVPRRNSGFPLLDTAGISQPTLHQPSGGQRRPVGRTTKVMTALLCLIDELDYDSLTVIENVVRSRIEEEQ